jgi:hypothetical protein
VSFKLRHANGWNLKEVNHWTSEAGMGQHVAVIPEG